MNMDAETRRALKELADSMPPPAMGEAGTTVVGVIRYDPNNPTTIDRVWPFAILQTQFAESVNAAGSHTELANEPTQYALNLGPKNPIAYQRFLFHNVDGYWIFQCGGQP